LNPEVTQVLSLSEALASLRHTYLGSFFFDPGDNRKLSIGAIWSLVGETGLPYFWGPFGTSVGLQGSFD